MTTFLEALAEGVLLADGAMGTQVQGRDLDIARDFLGCENCTEGLIRSFSADSKTRQRPINPVVNC